MVFAAATTASGTYRRHQPEVGLASNFDWWCHAAKFRGALFRSLQEDTSANPGAAIPVDNTKAKCPSQNLTRIGNEATRWLHDTPTEWRGAPAPQPPGPIGMPRLGGFFLNRRPAHGTRQTDDPRATGAPPATRPAGRSAPARRACGCRAWHCSRRSEPRLHLLAQAPSRRRRPVAPDTGRVNYRAPPTST
jgi:hypothetical protein